VAVLAFAVTAYSIAYAVTAPVLGSVSDRFGPVRLIAGGAALFIVGNWLVAAAATVGFLEAARALTGLGGAVAGPAIWAYIATDATPTTRGQAIGLGMGAFSLGQVAGIPAGGLIAHVADWRTALIGIGVAMVPLAVAAFFMPTLISPSAPASLPVLKPAPTRLATQPALGWFGFLTVWKSRAVAHALTVNLVFQAANLACYTFLGALLAERYQLTTTQIAGMGVLVGCGSFVGAMLGGRLNDRMRAGGGKSAQLQVIWAGLLGVSIFTATGDVPVGVAMLGIACWFVASGAFVTTQTALLTVLAPTRRATVVSWNNSLMHGGAALGVMAIGWGAPLGVTVGGAGVGFALLAVALAALLIPVESAHLSKAAP
jgi:DHA1 family inner membrane transport protein